MVRSQRPYERILELTARVDSDIVHFEVLGNHVVVVNSTKASNELLEKRSHIYSGKYVYRHPAL